MSEYVLTQAEELVESQRRLIESLRLACELKDFSINALRERIKKLEEKVN